MVKQIMGATLRRKSDNLETAVKLVGESGLFGRVLLLQTPL